MEASVEADLKPKLKAAVDAGEKTEEQAKKELELAKQRALIDAKSNIDRTVAAKTSAKFLELEVQRRKAILDSVKREADLRSEMVDLDMSLIEEGTAELLG